MGGSKAPATPSPQDSAKAEAMAQLAGSEFNLATAPTQAYAEALDQIQFNPIFQRIQNAEQANYALDNAKAGQAVNAAMNPYGSGAANAMNRATSTRLANVYGQPLDPGLTQGNTSGVFQYPQSSAMPAFAPIAQESKALSAAMPNVRFGGNGAVALNWDNANLNPQIAPVMPPSYLQAPVGSQFGSNASFGTSA